MTSTHGDANSNMVTPEVAIHSNGEEAHIFSDGFRQGWIGRSKRPSPWKLNQLVFYCYNYTRQNPKFMSGFKEKIKKSPVLGFTVHYSLEVNPEFHVVSSAPTLLWDVPVKTIHSFAGVGKSSIAFDSVFRNTLNGNILLKARITTVYVDNKTRRRTDINRILPKSHKQLTKLPEKMPVLPRDPVFAKSFTVNFSDIDANMHCNMAVYVRLCTDTASCAALEGLLTYFRDDLEFYKLAKLSIQYINECVVHDTICVQLWEDTLDPGYLYFKIVKGDKKLLTQCSLQYILNTNSKL